jgi:hypothetical protein
LGRMEVVLGKRPQPHELNVVRFKKAEIAGLNVHDWMNNALRHKTSYVKVEIAVFSADTKFGTSPFFLTGIAGTASPSTVSVRWQLFRIFSVQM